MKEPIAIDWMTGLPEVPDDYFWRVSKTNAQVQTENFKQSTQSQYGFAMSLGYQNREVGFVSLMRRVRVFKYKWRRESYDEQEELVRRIMICNTTKTPCEDNLELVEHDYSITPGSIRRTANEVMRVWEAAKTAAARKQEEDALMGDYPPKRLR